MHNDNRFLYRGVTNNIKKDSQCTLEAGAVVARLKKLRDDTTMVIKFEYSNDKVNPDVDFEQQPGKALMKTCDKNLK